jgi:hypothetical protein
MRFFINDLNDWIILQVLLVLGNTIVMRVMRQWYMELCTRKVSKAGARSLSWRWGGVAYSVLSAGHTLPSSINRPVSAVSQSGWLE